ncbi:hypothetical protein P4261_28390 [Bacillus thuringiensis]|nr:hypothetical protein [Bacillus thuringiensis]MED2829712.1 hypothetical protein [Bacillus thuringiensis]MED2856337.1 hypothetical protein [Bacillus thuringiensis]MED2863859.1 hypothetical protein [Bacillus thuringiensis]
MSSTQVQVNVDESAIRSDLGKQLGEAHVTIAVLREQVQALAADKINLENQVDQFRNMLEPAGDTEVIDAPVA